MTWLTTISLGSLAALLLMAAGSMWLGQRGKFEKTAMSQDTAGAFASHGAFDQGAGKSWFKGRAMGASWSAEISTYEVMQMARSGHWLEAMPWLVAILGALAAFLFWPLLVMHLCEVDIEVSIAFTLLVFVTALRAVWPRKP